jgi:hypothetical protein
VLALWRCERQLGFFEKVPCLLDDLIGDSAVVVIAAEDDGEFNLVAIRVE